MRKKDLIKLSNQELIKKLGQCNWCDRDLLKEYDERYLDGRIKFSAPIPLSKLEKHIREKYAFRRKKAS